jgi:hypothetical protein
MVSVSAKHIHMSILVEYGGVSISGCGHLALDHSKPCLVHGVVEHGGVLLFSFLHGVVVGKLASAFLMMKELTIWRDVGEVNTFSSSTSFSFFVVL